MGFSVITKTEHDVLYGIVKLLKKKLTWLMLAMMSLKNEKKKNISSQRIESEIITPFTGYNSNKKLISSFLLVTLIFPLVSFASSWTKIASENNK